MTGELRRAVYDCNVYVQSLLNPDGPAGSCVRRAIENKVALFLSAQILAEIRDAPNKPAPRRLGVTSERTETLIENLLKVATLVVHVPTVFSYERDPDDAHYIDLALATSTTFIVSRDRDLLDLMDSANLDAVGFRRRFPSLRILDPVRFLRELDAAG